MCRGRAAARDREREGPQLAQDLESILNSAVNLGVRVGDLRQMHECGVGTRKPRHRTADRWPIKLRVENKRAKDDCLYLLFLRWHHFLGSSARRP